MFKLPSLIPGVRPSFGGSPTSVVDVDTGGYDLMINGLGFRLATDQSFPYKRFTEQTTTQRFDNSAEFGDHSLSPLPWPTSQSTFHYGAGQLNLESPGNVQQVQRMRYEMSLGVDPWTPGEVKRLPDCLYSDLAFTPLNSCTGSVGGVDCAVIGTDAGLQQLSWTSPDVAPTITPVDLSNALYGGASNVTVESLCTDGTHYYALLQLATAGTGGFNTLIVSGSLNSASAPTHLYSGAVGVASHGTLGWAKERLVAGLDQKFYELDTTAAAAALPTEKYTHPNVNWQWVAISESPTAIVASGEAGYQSTILAFTLDSSGGAPTLAGGATLATMPAGERITALGTYSGSFLIIATTLGVRIGTFDTYTGSLSYGPLSLQTTTPVYGLTGRDRFIYAGFSDQQADGSTGLAAIDVSIEVDQGGRKAWAPSLRPGPDDPQTGTVVGVNTLPTSNRLMFITGSGLYVEGDGPGSVGDAWLRTSRIRYDTAEMKLFKLGRVHGNLGSTTIQITGITPFGNSKNLGTFGFVLQRDPGEFRLPSGLNEWLQLKFTLNGADCVLNSYGVKAYPAPRTQEIVEFTVNDYLDESDKQGLDVTDPTLPRSRFSQLLDLKKNGDEVRLVEFTSSGSVSQIVILDQVVFMATSRPTVESDFGGVISVRAIATEG